MNTNDALDALKTLLAAFHYPDTGGLQPCVYEDATGDLLATGITQEQAQALLDAHAAVTKLERKD